MVIPTWDRTLPTVIGCLDRAMRIWGGVQTYWLTDNERTVSIDHVAGIAVRNPNLVAAASHYGVTITTCVPYDPESKGGSEATVRIAKADLVPTEANLLPEYVSWSRLVVACDELMDEVNNRPHRVTRRAPTEMLGEEVLHLHRLPDVAYTAVFGETRHYRTERKIRTDRGRKERGRSTLTDGRVPDGELSLKDGKVVAIELDLTAKRSRQIDMIMRNYARSVYDGVWWFVRPGSVEETTALVQAQSAARLIDVQIWES